MGTTTGNDSIKTMFAGIYFGLPAVLIGVILRPFVFGFRKEGIESEWQGQRTYIQR
jgi:cytochrome bd-type quinol oxidase subunit 2